MKDEAMSMGRKNYEELVKNFEKQVEEKNYIAADKTLAEISKTEVTPESKENYEKALELFLEMKSIYEPFKYTLRGKMLLFALTEGVGISVPECLFSKGAKAAQTAEKAGLPLFSTQELELLKSKTFPVSDNPEIAIKLAFVDIEKEIESAEKNPSVAIDVCEYLTKLKGYLLEHPSEAQAVEENYKLSFKQLLEKFAVNSLNKNNISAIEKSGEKVGVELGKNKTAFLRIGDLQLQFELREGDEIYKIAKKAKLPIVIEKNNELKETHENLYKLEERKIEGKDLNDLFEKEEK